MICFSHHLKFLTISGLSTKFPRPRISAISEKKPVIYRPIVKMLTNSQLDVLAKYYSDPLKRKVRAAKVLFLWNPLFFAKSKGKISRWPMAWKLSLKTTSRQIRPISATAYLLFSLATIICGISLLLERPFRFWADNSFTVRWWLMIGLIPGMCKRFQIKVDGHCYSHPIWFHHPLSDHYNPSLIWYKNLPVMKANKDWQCEVGRTLNQS